MARSERQCTKHECNGLKLNKSVTSMVIVDDNCANDVKCVKCSTTAVMNMFVVCEGNSKKYSFLVSVCKSVNDKVCDIDSTCRRRRGGIKSRF